MRVLEANEPDERFDLVRASLHKLGDTTEKVVASLGEQGISGVQGSSISCPLAKYLKEETGETFRVGSFVQLHDCPKWASTAISLDVEFPHLTLFIGQFDVGRYPELIANVVA